MKGLSILALMIVAIACVVAQEESNDEAMLDFEADETAIMADDTRNTGVPVNCRNCHPHCPPSCVKPPHHHHQHRPYSHHCPSCPPRPTCPGCPPRPTCPRPPTCPPPPTCPTCPTCPTKPHCPITCPTRPPCPTCPPKPCQNPHPTLIGVCLDIDLGIGK